MRLLLNSRLHHVITGILTSAAATQVNTAGSCDTTVVFMGAIMMVAGTGVGRKVGTWSHVVLI